MVSVIVGCVVLVRQVENSVWELTGWTKTEMDEMNYETKAVNA